MSGAANVITLYDKDGNPVAVEFVDGQYRLRVTDTETRAQLQALQESLEYKLTQIIELLSA